VATAYVRKDGSTFIGWTDVGGQYREETRSLPDGRRLPVVVIVNSTTARRFLLTNPEGYSLTYNGLVMAAEKRQAHGWQAFGPIPSRARRAAGVQRGRGRRLAGQHYRRCALPHVRAGSNSLTNARGRLPNDRPHMFRVMGSVDVPRTGFVIAANPQYFSGKPWAATAQIALPQGDQHILLETRVARRLSSQSLLDVRVSRTFTFGGVDASSCSWTCSMRSTTQRRRAWPWTIGSARISLWPQPSGIHVARWWV
jgi:hypothetical protein